MPPVFDRKLQTILLLGYALKTGGSFCAKKFFNSFSDSAAFSAYLFLKPVTKTRTKTVNRKRAQKRVAFSCEELFLSENGYVFQQTA